VEASKLPIFACGGIIQNSLSGLPQLYFYLSVLGLFPKLSPGAILSKQSFLNTFKQRWFKFNLLKLIIKL
jgi:hypothetical protein